MNFLPGVQPPTTATPLAWCFAFVEGQLLLPDDEIGASCCRNRQLAFDGRRSPRATTWAGSTASTAGR